MSASRTVSRATTAAVAAATTRRWLATQSKSTVLQHKSPNWTPECAVPESKGKFFAVTDQFVPPHAKANEFMCRSALFDTISNINQQYKAGKNGAKICLDGKAGVGKSVVLAQTAQHFQSLGWLVLYFNDISHWLAGKEFYAKSKKEGLFTQHKVAHKVLQRLHELNGSALKNAAVLEKTLKPGLDDFNKAHSSMDKFLDTLFGSPQERPPVLFVVDALNALYTQTAYHDVDSSVLTSDRFELTRQLLYVITKSEIENGAFVGALDHSDSLLNRASFITQFVANSPLVGTAGDRTDVAFTNSTFSDRIGEFGVILPKSVSPSSYDPFTLKKDLYPKRLLRQEISGFTKEEVRQYLTEFENLKEYPRAPSEDFVQKVWMMTGGAVKQIKKQYI